MVKEHHRFFRGVLIAADITVIAASWGAAYWLRFSSGLVPLVTTDAPEPALYLLPLGVTPIVWPLIFRWLDLYRPRRTSSYRREAAEIVQGSTLAVLVLIAITYLVFKAEVSRLALLIFWAVSTAALIGTRIVFREILRFIRRRGYNLRHVLIVGNGELAHALVARIHGQLGLGLRVIGLLCREEPRGAEPIDGVPVIGRYDEVGALVRVRQVDQVVVALPMEDQAALGPVLATLDGEIVDVKVVPDFLRFATLRGGVEDFDGLPIVTLRTSPLLGWNSVLKRGLDLTVGSLALVVASPVMLVVALLVTLTDGGPILYRQERMGFDGRVFQMLKFRSMRVDAEVATGAVWAKADDPRVTWIGRIIRKTSLDELPQLWNVLKGEMSLAGPRPERPFLVERFRGELPGYMLRHKIKAGMTGWAQVNGWRGNTSLERRLEYDLYYIQNWSIWLDVKILFLTLFHGFVNRNAY